MIQDPYNPYGINRFPRIYRPRASSSGGIRAGAAPQMMGPQPGGRQGSGGGIPMGGSRTTTAPAQEQQQQGGALSGLLAGKETYDQITDAYKGGGKIRDAVSGFQPRMITDQLSALNPANIMRNKGLIPASTPTQMVNSGMSAVNVPGPAIPHVGMLADVGKGSSYVGGNTAGMVGGGGTQLANSTTKGAEAAANSSSKALAGAGAVAGMGLSAYDMYENGINFGNAAGFAGAGILAGTTMMGLANAWNPVGWALLAGSAAYSIFG